MENTGRMTPIAAALVAGAGLGCFSQTITAQTESRAGVLEEVIVTAARRESSVLEVPSTIDVLGGAMLEQTGAENFQDYLAGVPAVGLTTVGGSGASRLGIRGVSNLTGGKYGSADSVATVGLYLNDVPISGAGPLPDLDIYDLQRVEVLKGPQGTLYGEGAMGGAVRLLTNPVDYEAFSGRVEAMVGSFEGGGLRQRTRGVVNVPLAGGRAGLRVVGSYSERDGFIDNVVTGEDEVNSRDSSALRINFGWQLSDRVDIDLLYLRNDSQVDGYSDVDESLDDYQQSLLEDREAELEFEVYALTANIEFGAATLTSVSSLVDSSRYLRPKFFFLGMPEETFPTEVDQDTFTQELRLVSTTSGDLSWILGAFYRDRDAATCGEFDAPGAAEAIGAEPFAARPCPLSRTAFTSYRDTEEGFEQLALYGDFTYALTPTLELIGGVRWFQEDLTLEQELLVGGFLSFLSNASAVETDVDDVLYRAGVRFTPQQNLSTYAMYSQGFRSGGPNLNSALVPGVPMLYEPDTLDNFEIGAKFQSDDGRLQLNAALFYSEWQDVQITDSVIVADNPFGFQSNAGAAEISGAEVDLVFSPLDRFTAGISLAYLDSELTEVPPGSDIVAGQPLTNTPEWSGSAFAELGFDAPGGGDGFARIDYQYTGGQYPDLATGPSTGVVVGGAFRELEARKLLNLRVGADFSNWGVDVFVTNLLDEVLEYGIDGVGSGNGLIVGDPRVLGATLRYSF
ncbi:MAG: TonB-dependent receptor [Pseudohaliea sp.]